MIPLVRDTITSADIERLTEWLSTNPRLTKGELVSEFESQFSDYIGVNHAIFVNSGSSANLLMLYALKMSGEIDSGSRVVVPSLSWATDLSPVVQLGFEPVMCDCNLSDLSIDLDHFETLCKRGVRALILVSLLGLVPDMPAIQALCDKYGVVLIEDVCGSLGSTYKNSKLGSFGLMSSFSTYYGHHMSTIEGGLVCTDSQEFCNLLRSLRSHGWDRDLPESKRQSLQDEYDIGDFNALFSFYYPGFNFRPTEINAFLGIEQMKAIEARVARRNQNFFTYHASLSSDFWLPDLISDCYVSSFAFPVLAQDPVKLVESVRLLSENDIEVRPISGGPLHRQPYYRDQFKGISLPNSERVGDTGFYLPNNPDLLDMEIHHICSILNG